MFLFGIELKVSPLTTSAAALNHKMFHFCGVQIVDDDNLDLCVLIQHVQLAKKIYIFSYLARENVEFTKIC